MTTKQLTNQMRDCIQKCHECQEVCLETISYCLRKGGEHTDPDHIKLMLDCAEFCGVSANFMSRDSRWHKDVCELCAEICLRCADDCEEFEGDQRMMNCAEVCAECADSCRAMSKHSREKQMSHR